MNCERRECVNTIRRYWSLWLILLLAILATVIVYERKKPRAARDVTLRTSYAGIHGTCKLDASRPDTELVEDITLQLTPIFFIKPRTPEFRLVGSWRLDWQVRPGAVFTTGEVGCYYSATQPDGYYESSVSGGSRVSVRHGDSENARRAAKELVSQMRAFQSGW